MNDCTHDRLFFGSGDYYLFCQGCQKAWVLRGNKGDLPAPELSGPGPDNQIRVVENLKVTGIVHERKGNA